MRPYALASGLVLAAALAVAAGLLWNENRRLAERITLDERLSNASQAALRRAAAERDALQQKVDELDTQLGAAKTGRTAAETKSVLLDRELGPAREKLSALAEREAALLAELTALRQHPATPVEPAPMPATAPADATPAAASTDATRLQERIADLESQLADLLTRALAAPPAAASSGKAEPAGSAPAPRVVRVGPRDAFVILSYGSVQGAAPAQLLALQRGTLTVARVRITDVRAHFSAAQVLSDSGARQLHEGDLAVLTSLP